MIIWNHARRCIRLSPDDDVVKRGGALFVGIKHAHGERQTTEVEVWRRI